MHGLGDGLPGERGGAGSSLDPLLRDEDDHVLMVGEDGREVLIEANMEILLQAAGLEVGHMIP